MNTEELDVAPDLAAQQWWDDNWVQVVAGGSLWNPTLAWRYFATSIFIDHETDNWNLYVQFSEDPSFDWARMEETMKGMYGKQYRFNLPRCHPPNYWVLEKIHRYQQDVRNDLGRMVAVERVRVLEVFVVVERKVMKCSTLYDLANVRVLGAVHDLTITLDRLRSRIPPPDVRETSFWQSETVKVPEEKRLEEQAEAAQAPGVPTTTTTAPQEGDTVKVKRKRPDPYGLTILHAMQTTQTAIPGLLAPQGDLKTREEERAERMWRMVCDPGREEAVGAGGGGGVKRAVEESFRGVVKQARFEV